PPAGPGRRPCEEAAGRAVAAVLRDLVEIGPQLVDRRVGRSGERLPRRAEVAVGVAVERGEVEAVLAAERAVEAALAEAGRLGQRLQRRAGVAVAAEDVGGAAQDVLF